MLAAATNWPDPPESNFSFTLHKKSRRHVGRQPLITDAASEGKDGRMVQNNT